MTKAIIRTTTLFILVWLSPAAVRAQTFEVTQSVLDGKVEIIVPAGYTALSKDEIKKEYPDPRHSPVVIFRDNARDLSFKIIREDNDVAPNEVGQYKGWRVSRMLKDSTLSVIAHDLEDIHERKVGIIKVNYPSLQRYHHYFFTSLDGQLLLLILECASDDRIKLDEEFDRITSSLRLH